MKPSRLFELCLSSYEKLYMYMDYKFVPEFYVEKCKIEEKELGIWDILGQFRTTPKSHILICRREIRDFTDNLVNKRKVKTLDSLGISVPEQKFIINSIVTELVRVHEHCHAILHEARVKKHIALHVLKKLKPSIDKDLSPIFIDKWDEQIIINKSKTRAGIAELLFAMKYYWIPRELSSPLPPIVEEPIVELMSRLLICRIYEGNSVVNEIFRLLDEESPYYYREWRRILQELGLNENTLWSSKEYLSFLIPCMILVARLKKWRSLDDYVNRLKEMCSCDEFKKVHSAIMESSDY